MLLPHVCGTRPICCLTGNAIPHVQFHSVQHLSTVMLLSHECGTQSSCCLPGNAMPHVSFTLSKSCLLLCCCPMSVILSPFAVLLVRPYPLCPSAVYCYSMLLSHVCGTWSICCLKVMLHWSTCNANLQRRFATHVSRTHLQTFYTFESLSKTSNALQHCKYRKKSSEAECNTRTFFAQHRIIASWRCKLTSVTPPLLEMPCPMFASLCPSAVYCYVVVPCLWHSVQLLPYL